MRSYTLANSPVAKATITPPRSKADVKDARRCPATTSAGPARSLAKRHLGGASGFGLEEFGQKRAHRRIGEPAQDDASRVIVDDRRGPRTPASHQLGEVLHDRDEGHVETADRRGQLIELVERRDGRRLVEHEQQSTRGPVVDAALLLFQHHAQGRRERAARSGAARRAGCRGTACSRPRRRRVRGRAADEIATASASSRPWSPRRRASCGSCVEEASAPPLPRALWPLARATGRSRGVSTTRATSKIVAPALEREHEQTRPRAWWPARSRIRSHRDRRNRTVRSRATRMA